MKKRYDEVDILRGIAILGVIIIHITSSAIPAAQGILEENSAVFFNQFARFAVPAFLFLSGWGLTVSKKYDQNYKLFLKSQISKIIYLYVFWNVLYYFITSNNLDLLEMMKGIILGTSYYHLYYVPILIFFYLIYPVLYKILKLKWSLTLFLAITIISQLADIFTRMDIFNIPHNVFNWIFFFVFGIWFAENFHNNIITIKPYKVIIIISTLAMSIFVYLQSFIMIDSWGQDIATTSMRPSIILYSVLFILFVLVLNWGKNTKYILIKLANASYGIYLSHALILTIYQAVLLRSGISLGSIWYMISAFILVVISSYIIAIVMDKIEVSIKGKFKRQKTVPL